MHLPNPSDWQKKAFRTGVFGPIFLFIVFLTGDGINWLILGTKPRENDYWFILGMFIVMYFNEAIDCIHEHLKEIEDKSSGAIVRTPRRNLESMVLRAHFSVGLC